MPAMYSPALLPSRWRAAVAKNRIWSTAGGISSDRVRWIGLPVLRTSRSISSSPRASTASAMRNSASERSEGVASRQPSNASAATCMAASTSAAPDKAAVAYCSPVVGSTTAEVRPSAAGTERPPMKFWNSCMAVCCSTSPAPRHASSKRPAVWHIGANYSPAMAPVIRTVGVPKEVKTAEHRVAMTPDGVRELERHGINVYVEAGAGEGASISDADYVAAGADIVPTAADAWSQEMVIKVKEPKEEEFVFLRPDLTLFTYLHLAAYPAVATALVAAGTTALGLRDGATRRRRPAVAGADERGRRAPGARSRVRTSSNATTAGGAC